MKVIAKLLSKEDVLTNKSHGIKLLHTSYHYFFHRGESNAIPQQPAHRDLPYFVGGMPDDLFLKEIKMSVNNIKESVESVIAHYKKNPDDAKGAGAPFRAVMEEGLRCRVEKLDGTEILKSDMPKEIGGGGSAPSPGTLFRAALVSCDATLVALRAAQVGIELTTLEVTLEGDPEDMSTLGFLGIDDSISAGEPGFTIKFRIGSESASPEQLLEIIDWVEAHSPVGESVTRAIPLHKEVEVV